MTTPRQGTASTRVRLLLSALAALLLLAGCGEEAALPGSAMDQGSLPRSRLLSAEQYRNSIAAIFGEDISASLRPPIPPLARTDGLRANGAAFIALTSDQLAMIQRSGAVVAEKVVDETHRDYLISCQPDSADSAATDCAREYLREVGRLLYRRPLPEAQLESLVAVADRAASELEDFYAALGLALETLLVSPEFLFITDHPEPDPTRPGQRRLDGWSLASRLSFLLWNGPPDATLLRAAQSGELHTAEGLSRSVERMLSSARLDEGVRAFFDDMLGFEIFDSLAKDPTVYPMVTGTTLEHAREQTLRTLVDHLLRRGGDYRDLFTTRRSFMSPPLAAIYGVPAVPGWVPYTFDADSPRAGLLTHVSFLTAHSHAVRSSPTLRGKALRESFLCQSVPAPPPNVDFSALEENAHAKTARERLAAHNSNPSCAGCHLIMDPMGLALENFDGAGGFRERENGEALDISGQLDGAVYDSIEGLAEALRNHPKLSACLVNRLYAYGTGGPVSLSAERPALRRLEDDFADSGYRFPALLRQLALSPAFHQLRDAGAETEAEPAALARAPARITASMLALAAAEDTP